MSLKSKILFFTCATRYYENFVVPYVYFAKKHNPSSIFEFVIGDVNEFRRKHVKSLEWLEKNLHTQIVFRSASELRIKPKLENSIRFVMEPKSSSEYVYIGDVDIMIFEDLYEWHHPIFNAELPYSNIIRDNSKRLTGLHFARYDHQYPLPDIDDLIASTTNDEELLYLIIERKGMLYSNDVYNKYRRGRPIHGIHMSLNRLPFSYHKERVGWGMKYEWLEKFDILSETMEFKEFYETLYPGSGLILMNLIYLSKAARLLGRDYYEKFAVSR